MKIKFLRNGGSHFAGQVFAQTTHMEMLFDVGQLLVTSPKLWSLYDTHGLAKDRDTSPAAVATREAFFYQHLPPKTLKATLEAIQDLAANALNQIAESQTERSMRWKCKDCEYNKHFTRPVSLEAAGKCPRCKSTEFTWIPRDG